MGCPSARMDAYHIAYTLIALLLATAWFVRPRKPPLQDDPEAPHAHWRIMATTLNCAEAPSVRTLFGDNQQNGCVRAWLLRGADVYAVAVQECLCWDELREKILDHLGEDYVIVAHAAIGSQSSRGRIGLAVLARRCDVDAGAIYALGEKQLPLGAAATATKGSVSLEVKVGARTLCFLGAHLPADAGGLAQRSLRNACAAALLGGEEAVALQERCHVLLLGDLNYRAVPSDLAHARDSTLKRVAAARRRPVPVTWAAATRDDELSEDRRAGRALCGFREAPIYVAPTFRRVPGVALPGKDASADELCAAYTLFKPEAGAATVEEALAMARKTEAPPARAASAAGLRYTAWTDRVLAASPPADEAALELLAYDAPELFLRSDHRPARLRCTLARRSHHGAPGPCASSSTSFAMTRRAATMTPSTTGSSPSSWATRERRRGMSSRSAWAPRPPRRRGPRGPSLSRGSTRRAISSLPWTPAPRSSRSPSATGAGASGSRSCGSGGLAACSRGACESRRISPMCCSKIRCLVKHFYIVVSETLARLAKPVKQDLPEI